MIDKIFAFFIFFTFVFFLLFSVKFELLHKKETDSIIIDNKIIIQNSVKDCYFIDKKPILLISEFYNDTFNPRIQGKIVLTEDLICDELNYKKTKINYSLSTQ